jgi:hypothetical protein
MRVGLVGCVKSKQSQAAPARELYVSPLFRGRRAWVERTCDRWFILSAKHGLVEPDRVLAPYDEILMDLPRAVRRAWSAGVVQALEHAIGQVSGVVIELHAGSAYLDYGLVAGRPGSDSRSAAGALQASSALSRLTSFPSEGSPHPCATYGVAGPAEMLDSMALSRPSLIRPPWLGAATRDENRWARPSSALGAAEPVGTRTIFVLGWGEGACPLERHHPSEGQERSGSPAGDSWPVTCRDPALGTNTDSEPASQRTVISRPSMAVTTPLRVTLPTFSDSTTTRSPTSTMTASSGW